MTMIEAAECFGGGKMRGAGAPGVWLSHDLVRRIAFAILCLVAQACLCVEALSDAKVGSLDPRTSGADSEAVTNLSALQGGSYGRPGLSHLTVAGAVHHGMKEVEMWLQTFAPVSGTPIHRHDCEEIFLVLKGKGTLSLASQTDLPYPGKPREYSIEMNSTFTIPVNAVHQIRNSDEEGDLQHLAVISRPPIHVFAYADWFTPHAEAREVFPYPWDEELRLSPGDQCGDTFTGKFQRLL